MPSNDEACLAAARQRAAWAVANSDADFGFGLEGGVQPSGLGLLLTGWVVAQDRHGQTGIGGGGRLPLPRAIADRVRAGEELGR